jgi:hypothetical protein
VRGAGLTKLTAAWVPGQNVIGHIRRVCLLHDIPVVKLFVRRHERGEDLNVVIGRCACRGTRGIRVEVALLDAHFDG